MSTLIGLATLPQLTLTHLVDVFIVVEGICYCSDKNKAIQIFNVSKKNIFIM